QIDWAIWACFIASILPLVFLLPLILSASKLSSDFWAQPHWSQVEEFYRNILVDFGPLFIGSLVVGTIAACVLTVKQDRQLSAPEPSFLAREIGAILGLTALPLFGVLLAELVTNAFTDRYVLPAVLGISVLLAQVMYKLLGPRYQSAVAITLFLLAYL